MMYFSYIDRITWEVITRIIGLEFLLFGAQTSVI